jgi:glutamate synthase (NADPH/NADH) large chain
VHSRYSTNTFPSWPLAQPLRMLAHNGEINTVGANRNWMRARQSQLESELIGDIRPLLPICTEGERLGILRRGARTAHPHGTQPPHAVMMMVPEAYEKQADIAPTCAFYEYHSMQMEPWDGPPPHLHRRHARRRDARPQRPAPGRWTETTDGLVVIGSETGVLDFAPSASSAAGVCARTHVPRRHRPASHHRGRRGQG